jgi:hypothetical protein
MTAAPAAITLRSPAPPAVRGRHRRRALDRRRRVPSRWPGCAGARAPRRARLAHRTLSRVGRGPRFGDIQLEPRAVDRLRRHSSRPQLAMRSASMRWRSELAAARSSSMRAADERRLRGAHRGPRSASARLSRRPAGLRAGCARHIAGVDTIAPAAARCAADGPRPAPTRRTRRARACALVAARSRHRPRSTPVTSTAIGCGETRGPASPRPIGGGGPEHGAELQFHLARTLSGASPRSSARRRGPWSSCRARAVPTRP